MLLLLLLIFVYQFSCSGEADGNKVGKNLEKPRNHKKKIDIWTRKRKRKRKGFRCWCKFISWYLYINDIDEQVMCGVYKRGPGLDLAWIIARSGIISTVLRVNVYLSGYVIMSGFYTDLNIRGKAECKKKKKKKKRERGNAVVPPLLLSLLNATTTIPSP